MCVWALESLAGWIAPFKVTCPQGWGGETDSLILCFRGFLHRELQVFNLSYISAVEICQGLDSKTPRGLAPSFSWPMLFSP